MDAGARTYTKGRKVMQQRRQAAVSLRGADKAARAPGAAGALLAALAMAAFLAGPAARAADNLRRCEDAAGHVTYSNEACPEGTSRERKVENRPAVEVPRDAAAEKAAAGARPVGIVPSAAPAARAVATPESEKEVAQEKRKSLVARCDDLVRRIEYGQQDLLSAAPGERASVELGVRRLQEEHESLCAPPKPQ
jgi:hypothetical protein